ncbi:MAG TPA: hypothetical protein VEB22_09335, partial [Phycisphaerales bacterium]|nr:hypothetical protein [Phycisphaerales bacterium]
MIAPDRFAGVVRLILPVALIAATPALADPVNNNRANATAVGVPATISGTTVAATLDAPVSGSCGFAANSPDVWYLVGPAATADGIKVSTCGGASFDTVLQAFVAEPGNTLGAQVACNDDDPSCGTPSSITWGMTVGQSYYIRVSPYSNGGTGTFTLSTQVVAPPPPASAGPDVTVGECWDIANYGTQLINGQTIRGFAVGTNSWNIGDRPVAWYSGTTRHPVIGQHMYRLKDGKFEQIGMSWLKHGFASTNSPDFGDCQQPPDGGSQLGVNCADLYDSGLNGSRSFLGPRFDVNPITGAFTANWQTLVGPAPGGADVATRRLQVLNSDWNNAGAQYWVDTQYVTADDAQWNNGRNNVSARKLSVTSANSAGFSGLTIQRSTALEAWPTVDPTVLVSTVDFHELTQTAVDPLGGPSQIKNAMGRFLVASKVTENAGGTWNYEYAIMNINSHRAASAFSVRTPLAAAVTAQGFHAPFYHSGDRIDNTPWTNTASDGVVRFATNTSFPATMTLPGTTTVVATVPNYVHWGTLYNVRFTASVPPTVGRAQLTLGRPAADATGYQGTSLAVTNVRVPSVCVADTGSQGGIAGADGTLDNNDFIAFIDGFFNANLL